MQTYNSSKRFLAGILLAALCFFPPLLHAQTEAQAGQDVLEIQKVKSGRTQTIEPGDVIRYPIEKGKFNVEEKADVVSIESDDEIVVRNRSGENAKVNLKLGELRYFRRLNKTMLAIGWTLFGLGMLIKIAISISVFFAILPYWGLILSIAAFFGVLLFEYFSPLVLAAAIFLIVRGRRRIFKPKWSWKKKLKIIKTR